MFQVMVLNEEGDLVGYGKVQYPTRKAAEQAETRIRENQPEEYTVRVVEV